MADIVLAQFGVRTWLVSGVDFIDDLLANTLQEDITIEFVACESESQVRAMWLANCADPTDAGTPWFIQPAIAERCRKTPNRDGTYRIQFGQWSAMRDAEGDAMLESVATDASHTPGARIVLTTYVDANGPALHADLANLRSGLIEAELAAKGIAASRFERTRGIFDLGDPTQPERVDITIITV